MAIPFDRGRPMFARTRSFEEAFPTLEDVMIEYVESGIIGDDVLTHEAPKEKIRLRTFGAAVRCGNPECRTGKYAFDSIVNEMLAKGESVMEGRMRCGGTEGSPKLQRVRGHCFNSVNYRIELIPKK
jgi:hypothetical protein